MRVKRQNKNLEMMNEELLRKAVFYRDGGECQYCGEPQSIDDFSLGYIVPLEQGGTSDITNRRCMCQRCEELKDDSTDEQLARRIIYFRIHQLLELFDPDLIPVFAKIWGEALKKGCINITGECGDMNRYTRSDTFRDSTAGTLAEDQHTVDESELSSEKCFIHIPEEVLALMNDERNLP